MTTDAEITASERESYRATIAALETQVADLRALAEPQVHDLLDRAAEFGRTIETCVRAALRGEPVSDGAKTLPIVLEAALLRVERDAMESQALALLERAQCAEARADRAESDQRLVMVLLKAEQDRTRTVTRRLARVLRAAGRGRLIGRSVFRGRVWSRTMEGR